MGLIGKEEKQNQKIQKFSVWELEQVEKETKTACVWNFSKILFYLTPSAANLSLGLRWLHFC